MEANQSIAALQDLLDRRRQGAVAKGEGRPLLRLPARLCQALPKAVAFILQQQNLDCAAGGLPVPQQPGWQDAGIVDDQAVARGEIITKVCKVPVLQRTSPAVQV